MKTEQLIDALARELQPVNKRAPVRAFALAVAAGVAIALSVVAAWLGFNPKLRSFVGEPMFWAKESFGIALAVSSLWLAARLARPGARVAIAGLLPLAPVAGLWLLAAPALAAAAPSERAQLVWGETWAMCLIGIPLLSVPTLIATLAALRSMAPTRPELAGAAAGAVAGGLGAAVYALHCPELDAPFLAVWYVIGALIPVAAGALLGRAALRW